MNERPDTTQGAAEYTMGIKFQVRLHMDEAFIRELSDENSKKVGKAAGAAGAACMVAAVCMIFNSAPVWGGCFFGLGLLCVLLGITVPAWFSKVKFFLLKCRKKDGTFKATVYETEFLIYSEQYQTCETLSLKHMIRWEKKNGIYKIYAPGHVFAFRENEFLSGNAAAFEVFLNETERKNN